MSKIDLVEYSLIIVDDHPIFSGGLKHILEHESRFKVIDVCNSADELLHLLNSKQPDLIVMDIQMSGTNGIDACKTVKKRFPNCKVVIMSMFESKKMLIDSRLAGASGYIPKSTDAKIMIDSLTDILNQKEVFIRNNIQNVDEEQITSANTIALLSKREIEIIKLIKEGFTTKHISTKLSISEFTTETHRKNILRKLGFSSLSELISFIHKNNI